MEKRVAFLRGYDQYPTQLFVSLDWAEQCSHHFSVEQKKPAEPVHGKQFYNMVIHVVPSIQGFYVA